MVDVWENKKVAYVFTKRVGGIEKAMIIKILYLNSEEEAKERYT